MDFNVLASFYAKVYDILSRHCRPINKPKSSIKYPAWFDGETISLLKKKKRLYNQFRKSKLPSDESRYKNARDTFKARNRAQHTLYLNNLQKDIQSNPKNFWTYVNAKRHDKRVPVNVCYNNEKAENSDKAAEMFSKYFKSVFDVYAYEPSEFQPSVSALAALQLSLRDVRNRIFSLDLSKGSGPDGIPNSLLQRCVPDHTKRTKL